MVWSTPTPICVWFFFLLTVLDILLLDRENGNSWIEFLIQKKVPTFRTSERPLSRSECSRTTRGVFLYLSMRVF